MAKFEITGPKGELYEVDAPDSATEAGVLAYAREQMAAGVPSQSYKEGRGEGNPVVRGLVSVAQGPSLGFSDEIIGAVGGAYNTLTGDGSFSENYRSARDYARGVQDQYREDFPIGAATTQLMASAPTLLLNPLGKVGQKALGAVAPKVSAWLNPTNEVAGMLQNTTRAAAAGAGYGAVTGAGESKAEDLAGVAIDSAKAAGYGAATAGALQPAQAVLGGAGRNVIQRVRPKSADSYAQQKVAEALARDARGEVFESGAGNAVRQAEARFGRLGPEARVVDAGGQNTRQLLDTVATLPGRSKNAVEAAIHDRQAGRAGRMIAAADDALGINGARMSSSIDGWISSRQMQAAPLYNRLNEVRVTPDDELRAIIQAADELGATKLARNIATAKRLPFSLELQQPRVSSLMGAGQASWSMRDLDLVKQGLDTAIAKKWDAQAGKLTPEGQSLLQLKKDLTDVLDRMTTNRSGQSLYRQARDAFAGPTALIDAANSGRSAFMRDETAIRGAMQGLTTSETEAFRLGAFEALRSKLGKMAGQTEILNGWRDAATREKLKAVFGSESEYRRFALAAAREARLKGMESVGRGSQTASRLYGAGDLDVSPLVDTAALASSAAHGNAPGVLAGAANLWNRVKTPEPVRDSMGRILLSQGPEGAAQLRSMEGLLGRINARRATIAEREGSLLGYGFAGLLSE